MTATETKLPYATWFARLRESLTDPTLKSPLGDALPAFPSEELQRNTTSLAGVQAIDQASGFYFDLSEVLERSGNPIGNDWQILDFGSCWGRISRFFLRDVRLEHIHGIDVERTFVETCISLFGTKNFKVCTTLPPSEFNSSSVNLIVAYSVFSHLSEFAFTAWLNEFHRILTDNGVIAFTTRSKAFFDYCKSLCNGCVIQSAYQKGLAGMVSTIGDFEQRYARGDFIFVTGNNLSGGGAMNESFYGEAFIPPAYVERCFAGRFDVLGFKPVGEKYDQALFVLRKRA